MIPALWAQAVIAAPSIGTSSANVSQSVSRQPDGLVQDVVSRGSRALALTTSTGTSRKGELPPKAGQGEQRHGRREVDEQIDVGAFVVLAAGQGPNTCG
jgi:hypothetical protein